MKTSKEIHSQWDRIMKISRENSRNFMRNAHPETDGNRMLVNNWGNDAAKVIYYREMDRDRKIYGLFKYALDRAFVREYPDPCTGNNEITYLT